MTNHRKKNLTKKREQPFISILHNRRDCNWTRTQNHLVLKRTLNHLAKLVFYITAHLSNFAKFRAKCPDLTGIFTRKGLDLKYFPASFVKFLDQLFHKTPLGDFLEK